MSDNIKHCLDKIIFALPELGVARKRKIVTILSLDRQRITA